MNYVGAVEFKYKLNQGIGTNSQDDEMEFCTGFAGKLGFRKTISWMLILLILEGIEKGIDKEWIYDRCHGFLRES